MLFICSLCHAHSGYGILGREHVPRSVGAEHQAPVAGDVHRVDPDVRLRTDHEHVFFTVVGPEVAQRPGHGQERDLVDMSGTSHRTLVAHLRPIPDHSWNARLADNFSSTLSDSLALLCKRMFQNRNQETFTNL